ncbi:hypothetical protein ABH920_002761 [Catenulispora sp. EB89]|uniref:hypothetical protein n=1 Tax=Catenulispora sp. EB89 TaxID=3156257 RepID=UPI003518D4CB
MPGAITAAMLGERARTWWQEEPALLLRETVAMATLAPDLHWQPQGAGLWQGSAPWWPFDRPAPAGLDALSSGRTLKVQVAYGHGFPVAAPSIWALDPEPQLAHRLNHAWHVNGDGSLCLLASPAVWSGREPAAELVAKAVGWFIEYLLLSRGLIEAMTNTGIGADPSLDTLIRDAEPDGDRWAAT